LRTINKELGIQVGVKFDVPNGYIPQVKEKVIELRKEFPEMFIMVGNVVTGDITEDLILSGADCVAVGIGPGCQCLTRPTTGCGRPQLSAIIECADAAH
jgi:GMP reductase